MFPFCVILAMAWSDSRKSWSAENKKALFSSWFSFVQRIVRIEVGTFEQSDHWNVIVPRATTCWYTSYCVGNATCQDDGKMRWLWRARQLMEYDFSMAILRLSIGVITKQHMFGIQADQTAYIELNSTSLKIYNNATPLTKLKYKYIYIYIYI